MWKERQTRAYRIPSSQFELISGTMPSLWAMYSSGSTLVFMSISIMSMATKGQTLPVNKCYNPNINNERTKRRYVCHDNSSYRVCKASIWTGHWNAISEALSHAHAKSTFSRTKLTLSFFSSRILTVGSLSSWFCITTEPLKEYKLTVEIKKLIVQGWSALSKKALPTVTNTNNLGPDLYWFMIMANWLAFLFYRLVIWSSIAVPWVFAIWYSLLVVIVPHPWQFSSQYLASKF